MRHGPPVLRLLGRLQYRLHTFLFPDGKEVPLTIHTSRHFPNQKVARRRRVQRWLILPGMLLVQSVWCLGTDLVVVCWPGCACL